jgi:D-alanyl-D-alanine carboxypeptidase (penicillin-binding protein 5/6)
MPEVCAFLEEMNQAAIDIGLKGTFYDSPHGLINWCNRSTAFDLAKLSCQAMKNSKFRQIVGTKYYKVPKVISENLKNSRSYNWENT